MATTKISFNFIHTITR